MDMSKRRDALRLGALAMHEELAMLEELAMHQITILSITRAQRKSFNRARGLSKNFQSRARGTKKFLNKFF